MSPKMHMRNCLTEQHKLSASHISCKNKVEEGGKKKIKPGEKKKKKKQYNTKLHWSLISSPINEKILAPILKFYSLLINIMWNFRWIS